MELRKTHGLVGDGDATAEDGGDGIVLCKLDYIVARAQALSRKALAGYPSPSLDDFLKERAREAEAG